MKSVVYIVTAVCFILAFSMPAAAAELQGGYYIVCDCALGSGVRFYVPASAAEGCLTYDSSGYLFNISNSTIYLYSPDYPDYTFSASRFAGFQYRASSGAGYTYYDLNIRNVTDTNVEIYTEDPALSKEMDFLELLHTMVEAGSFAIAFLLLLKVGDKRV